VSWKCKSCGFEANTDGKVACEACGYYDGQVLVLQSQETGKAIRVRISTTVGKHLLRTFAGEEARFASDSQFRVTRDSDTGAWIIEHAPDAKNPTFLNGGKLEACVPLESGACISIGPEKMRLVVAIEA